MCCDYSSLPKKKIRCSCAACITIEDPEMVHYVEVPDFDKRFCIQCGEAKDVKEFPHTVQRCRQCCNKNYSEYMRKNNEWRLRKGEAI